jgi:hypothetical protein
MKLKDMTQAQLVEMIKGLQDLVCDQYFDAEEISSATGWDLKTSAKILQSVQTLRNLDV